jgi:hypothetical protein
MDVSSIALSSRTADGSPRVLAAGVGGAGVDQPGEKSTGTDEDNAGDERELVWRLRHLKRSVLKDAGVIDLAQGGGADPFATLGRAVGSPARLATALFSDLPLTGQVDLLTSTSFDRPQDLFSADAQIPRSLAFLSLEAPTAGGIWAVQGAMTQGDIASWIFAGSFMRTSPSAHRYEAGASYGMQRYMGGNANALAAVGDSGRNVGSLYAFDSWTISPSVMLGYGAKYSRYDYLAQQGLWNPRVSLVLTPTDNETFKVRATLSRRAVAPGAEEFSPSTDGVWLPPERTFSPLTARRGFSPEHVDQVEFAAERDWVGDVLIGVRAFRQDVSDQIVTLFGVELPDRAPSNIGHYFVASGGSFEALGWGISVSRPVGRGVRAAVDYTMTDATWQGGRRDARMLSRVAASTLREQERLQDVTTSVESVVPITDTRVFVIYKFNTGFADAAATERAVASRFDVQVNQALPFMNFTSTQWEMLVAVRNLFRDDLMDASVYDELLVVRPPKRIVGGVTVKF